MAEMMESAMVPKVKLYTGEEIPCVGMGTFGSDRFTPEQVSNACLLYTSPSPRDTR